MSRKILIPAVAVVVCFLIGAVVVREFGPQIAAMFGAEPPRETRTARTSKGSALIGGDFALVDHTGKTRTDEEFRGKLMLVFFGFTHCPDVCPTTLQTATEALRKLGDDADRVRVLFVSIDPERDTPEQLAKYHDAFDPRITMLTGTPEQVAKAAKAYRVYYAKRPLEGGEGYTMDHSAYTYLMGRDGKYLTHFSHKSSPEQMVEGIRKHL